MLGQEAVTAGSASTVSEDGKAPQYDGQWPLSTLQDTPGPGRSGPEVPSLTSHSAKTVDVDLGNLGTRDGSHESGTWHSTPTRSQTKQDRETQFVLRFRRNDSMPECEFLDSDSPSTLLPLSSLPEVEDEGTKSEVTSKPKAFTLRLNSNDSMPECLLLARRQSSPVTPDELSVTAEEEEEECGHDTSHSTLVMEDGINPYHVDKELFFPLLGINVDRFAPSSPSVSPSQHSMGKKVTVNGRDIALFCHNNQFYAVDEKCPHMGGPLHLGDIEDMGATESPRIVCPWHRWCFELTTGKQVRPKWRHNDIQSYPVKTDDSGGMAVGFASIDSKCFGIIDDF